jgi:hypothetical protein
MAVIDGCSQKHHENSKSVILELCVAKEITVSRKLSKFPFPNCQNFPFPNFQNFPFQTVKISFSNCQKFSFKTIKIFISKTVKRKTGRCVANFLILVLVCRASKKFEKHWHRDLN